MILPALSKMPEIFVKINVGVAEGSIDGPQLYTIFVEEFSPFKELPIERISTKYSLFLCLVSVWLFGLMERRLEHSLKNGFIIL